MNETAEPTLSAESQPEAKPLPEPLAQLYRWFLTVGACVLVLSLSFNAFVLKQNRNLSFNISHQQNLLKQHQIQRAQVLQILQIINQYAQTHPEARAILAKYRVEIGPPPSPATPPPVSLPAPVQ
jgi:hypothetical protein